MTRAAGCALVVALAACGGPQGADERGGGSEPEGEPRLSEQERILAEHQARQLEACDAMCTRLTECAIADTRENAPEALEGVDVDALAEHYRETECLGPCETSKLSSRQLQTLQACNAAGGDCAAYQDCLDAVQPRREAPDAGPAGRPEGQPADAGAR